jgi:hypothetical protein
MRQPLYFLPGVRWTRGQNLSVTRSIIREAGLADIFSDVSEDHVGWAQMDKQGPGGHSGTFVFYVDNREPPRRAGFYPTEQKWTQVGDGSKLWIGVDKEGLPKPDDIRRRRVHSGYVLELGDGNRYEIPVVRRPDGSTGLPCDMVFDAAGKLQEPIKPAYERYWEESEKVLAMFVAENEPRLSKEEVLRHCITLLGINYRFGFAEQSAMRLIDGNNWSAILWASIDGPGITELQECQKKT